MIYRGEDRPYRVWAKRFGMSQFRGNPFQNGTIPETDQQFRKRVKTFLEKREKGFRTAPWRRDSGEHL